MKPKTIALKMIEGGELTREGVGCLFKICQQIQQDMICRRIAERCVSSLVKYLRGEGEELAAILPGV